MNQEKFPNWGEQLGNHAVGDTLCIPKDQNTIRIHYQNVNGISLGKGGTWEGVCDAWKHMEVDIGLICEHKLDTTYRNTIKGIKEGADRHFGMGVCRTVVGSTPISQNRQYKPGGVMAMTMGPVSGRVMKTHKDKFGRWVSMTFRRRHDVPLTIICTYQVVDVNPEAVGAETYAAQLRASYDHANRPNPNNIRQHHCQDLLAYVKEKQTSGEVVMVLGDFNEVMGEDEDGLTKLITDCNLVDVMANKHFAAGFTTYARGSRVLDYCLMDQSLLWLTQKCGFEPFAANIVSDHRGLFLDFKGTNLFRGGIYRQLIEASQRAGKKLKPYHNAPYSPEIAMLRNTQHLMKIVVKSFRSKFDLVIQVEEARRKLGTLGFTMPDNLRDCLAICRKYTTELKAAIKQEEQTRQKRNQHIQELIAKASGDPKHTASILKRIRRAEEVKKVYQKCAAIRGKNIKGGLSYLMVPSQPGADPKTCQEWRMVDCPEEIEMLLEERNRAHFGQSKDCNLTSEPFDFTMLFTGACHKAEAILNGTFTTDEELFPPEATTGHVQLRELTRIFLEACAYVNNDIPNTISNKLTLEEYKGKIKVWDERTSTSPLTNMHLGHLKAYWALHLLDKDSEEGKTLESQREEILQGHIAILNYALQYGHSYDSWKMVVNSMIEKEPGNPKQHRLRTIHLYENDYNLILSVKWRNLLQFACSQGFIHESLFGSRPGKEAMDAKFMRALQYEMARLTRHNTIFFDNDATSCYDRIPVFIANVISRKYGMDKMVCMVNGRTLAEARYHLKTKLGISDTYIEHSRAYPIFGVGQGAGDAAFKWLFISSILVDIYDKLATGAKYVKLDNQMELHVKSVAYVDDDIKTFNLFDNPHATMRDLAETTTTDCQTWHDLMLVSNQALELPKCGYHAVEWEFAPNGEPSVIDKPDASIVLKDANGQNLTITQWPNSRATKYLGSLESISTQKPQYQSMMSKCKDFARIVKCGHLTRRETHMFYWAIYKESIGFPLPICYFTEKELDDIQRSAHRQMVAQCGYNRNTATIVLYAPYSLGGCDFFHLYDVQGYGQVRLFVKFWRSPHTHNGKMLRIAVAWAQFNAGTGASILEDTTTKLPHLEAAWLKSLRQYLQDVGGTLEMDNPAVAKLQREGDAFLMDIAINSGKFGRAQLKRINYCRMYMNVLLVSDVANASGTALDINAYKGIPTINTTKYRVHQKRPDKEAWTQWRRLLLIIANRNASHTLKQPLGRWLVPSNQLRRKWKHLYDPDSGKLFHHTILGYTQHSKLRNDYDKTPDQDIIDPEIPLHAIPVDTSDLQYTWGIKRYWKPHCTPNYNQTHGLAGTVTGMLTTMEQWEFLLLQHLEVLDCTEDTVWNTLCNYPCYLATDGSAPPNRGSFAWIISDAHGNILAKCNGPVFGYKISSYRAEAYGILSLLRFLLRLRRIRQPNPEEPNKILPHVLLCDNEGVVKRINIIKEWPLIYPNVTMEAEWDVLAEIREALAELTPASQPTLEHIRGHQDKTKPREELPLKAQLNCQCDDLANEYLQSHQLDHSKVPLLPTTGCQLHLAQGTVTRDIKNELKLARTVPPMKEKLCHRHGWSQEDFDNIDWVSYGRGMRRLQKHKSTLVKYMNDMLPIGKLVHEYNPKYPRTCPSCPAPLEDRDHFWRCPATSRNQWRRECHSQMLQELNKHDTSPQLQTLYLNALDALLYNKPLDSIPVDPSVAEVAQAQADIGWHQILFGRFALHWQQSHNNYLGNRATSKNNGVTWMTTVIQVWLQQWLKLWKLRNEDRHGRDEATERQAQERQIIREVQMFYENHANRVGPNLQWLFQTPLQEKIQGNITNLRIWISTWLPVVEKSYTTALNTG